MNVTIKTIVLSLILMWSTAQKSHVSAQEVTQGESEEVILSDNEAAGDNQIQQEEPEAYDAKGVIMHHIMDENVLPVIGNIELPLPVIVRKADGAWSVGMSSQYKEGKDGLILSHGKIVNADTHDTSGLMDFSITKNVFMMLISVALLFFIFFSVKSAYSERGVTSSPKGLQSFLEPIITFMIDDVMKPNFGDQYLKYVPYIFSVFFFILINNLLGLIPFAPFGANLTGNISLTLTLAVITFLITNIKGTKSYWSHTLFMPGIPKAMWLLMTPLETLGLFTKPFALMIRLFANMTSGHTIVLSLISLIFILGKSGASIGGAVGGISVAVPFVLFMNALEILVAFLQAYIFALLSAIFIGSAVVEEAH